MGNVPVLLIVYRRPELTARVFQAIAAARPRRLFVAADGAAHAGEAEACAETRRVVSQVTWPCEVHTDFASSNLGCERRVTSAVDWLFEYDERGIVLEDDCIPAPDFFGFCAELLERYQDDTRVMHISGETYAPPGVHSYYFSKYALTWGWATWKRAWRLCDRDLATWPAFRDSPEAASLFDSRDERDYWLATFQQRHERRITDWDYAWWYTCMTQGLSIHPSVNLVSNLGSGETATHTQAGAPCHRPVGVLPPPLRHPVRLLRSMPADRETFDHRLVGSILKHQRSWRHQAGRPGRWARRAAGALLGR